MPFDVQRRKAFTEAIGSICEHYGLADDPHMREGWLRDAEGVMLYFKEDDYPDLHQPTASATAIKMLRRGVDYFLIAINYSNYEKADRYLTSIRDTLALRDTSLDG